jgi:arsenate reductase (thioredoxin)
MVPDADDPNTPARVRGARYRLRGPSRIDPAASAGPPRASVPPSSKGAPSKAASPKPPPPKAVLAKKRVLFVCIGNSCRSQMAEAFARAYGADIIEAQSAGLFPATYIAPLTKQTLSERNLNIDNHFPKGMDLMRRQPFDVVVNMSGVPTGLPGARVIDWTVPDPIGQTEDYFRTVAAQIEGLVMRLILELRAPQ